MEVTFLTSVVKAVAFKAHLLLAAKNSLKDKEYFSNCLIHWLC